ncbi:immunoglobulin-like domain-containing protein [Macrococcoides bohemicum]|uniref:immunoglobulin-like domain-containing protein n=1 Tax=Macrococcoides bohemicum TaxID=1903056 RepID=UPI00193F92B3|nr:immunoglobulin-like domain-containing protein [Macrococcus bohemicus]QRN50903.1 DUF5011 domain-containing protein [Macrococcus bohemicus]QYA44741.1 DUF5011 domain-containing protein [Macrococcus bohemicus]
MKVSKLYSTSIAAALLSTTILTGVASAAENKNTATPTATPAATPAPTAQESLTKTIISAKEELLKAKDTFGESDTNYQSLEKAISAAETLIAKKDVTESELTAENKTLSEAKTKTRTARLTKSAADTKALIDAKKALNAEIDVKVSTDSKPTKLVADYVAKKKEAVKVYGDPASKVEDLNKAKDALVSARETVVNSPKVIKLSTGTNGKLTINFKTLDGRTDFPKSTGKLTSTGTVTAEKGTDYIEVYDLRDLTKKYQLTLPQGFEINNPDKVPANAEEITNIDLKQTPGYKFDEALVTFTLKRDGQVIKSAIPSFTVLQETGYDNRYSDVTTKLTDEQLKDIKAYYLKEGYIVDSSSKFTFNKESFYQTAEINYIKKPEAPPAPVVVDGPGMSSFNGYQFKAGQKYTLPTYVELYEDPKSNIQMNNKDFNIKVMSVTPVGNKKKLPVVDNKVTFTKPGNYTVKFAIYDKDGHRLKDYKGKERNFLYVSNTATVVDSAPVISGVKSTTYSKKTFSYTKGIKAYDYVDKKYVKVTYKGKVNPSKKGKYKIYYSATDSKGNTAKKTRYVVVK